MDFQISSNDYNTQWLMKFLLGSLIEFGKDFVQFLLIGRDGDGLFLVILKRLRVLIIVLNNNSNLRLLKRKRLLLGELSRRILSYAIQLAQRKRRNVCLLVIRDLF